MSKNILKHFFLSYRYIVKLFTAWTRNWSDGVDKEYGIGREKSSPGREVIGGMSEEAWQRVMAHPYRSEGEFGIERVH